MSIADVLASLELSDEAKAELEKKMEAELQSEGDRRATQAAQTAREKAEAELRVKLEAENEAKVAASLEAMKAAGEEAQQAKIQEMEKTLKEMKETRLQLSAKQSLLDNGISGEDANTLLPLIMSGAENEADIQTNVTTLTAVQKAKEEAAIDAYKKQLAGNATPPGASDANIPDGNKMDIAAKRKALEAADIKDPIMKEAMELELVIAEQLGDAE